MQTSSSNAKPATTGGSVDRLEIRDGLTLRHAVAKAIWETLPNGENHPEPFDCLPAESRAEQLASADAACRVIAERVLLPRVVRCLKQSRRHDTLKPTAENAMTLAICYESVIQTLTGMTAAAAHEWVQRHGSLERKRR